MRGARPDQGLPSLALLLFGFAFAVAGGLSAADPARFVNVAPEVGLAHVFPNGGDDTKKWILETTGSGAAWIDYDNDGDLDAFLVSGEGGTNRLYRNDEGRFTDVTEKLGLASDGWGQGVCAGDYDNDGFTDLAVTFWGRTRLYRNAGGERFEMRELPGERYHTGCAFLDYDRDGDLDLFTAVYLKFDFETTPEPGDNPYCFYRNIPTACGPRGLPFDRNRLFRNDGEEGFTDVSEESGIAAPDQNYSLGVVTGDWNDDGWTDLYVACDRTPSILYINQQDGTFEDEALFRGAALDQNGKAMSGMGVAVGDYNGDRALDIFRTNFSDERSTLYRNRGEGDFDETTVAAGMGHNTRYVGWGAGFFDYDLDGWPDLLLVNGHIAPEVDRLDSDIRFRERSILYRNAGQGRFDDVSETAGPAIVERHAARGAAFGDYDLDGGVEVLVNSQNEPPALIRRERPATGSWVLLALRGTMSNRSAVGARVAVTAGGRTQVDAVRSGGSYLSQNDLRLHFGLGAAETIEKIEIRWPNGGRQTVEDLPVNRVHELVEAR